jgi:hypothetical protein
MPDGFRKYGEIWELQLEDGKVLSLRIRVGFTL